MQKTLQIFNIDYNFYGRHYIPKKETIPIFIIPKILTFTDIPSAKHHV